jgi:hypothetical protein
MDCFVNRGDSFQPCFSQLSRNEQNRKLAPLTDQVSGVGFVVLRSVVKIYRIFGKLIDAVGFAVHPLPAHVATQTEICSSMRGVNWRAPGVGARPRPQPSRPVFVRQLGMRGRVLHGDYLTVGCKSSFGQVKLLKNPHLRATLLDAKGLNLDDAQHIIQVEAGF